jgi:phosphoribosylformylglycinamidine synthase
LAECCITGKRGAKVEINHRIRNDALLFGETQSRIVVSLPVKNLDSFKQIAHKYEAPIQILGKVEGNSLKIGNLIDIEVEQLKKAWERDIN